MTVPTSEVRTVIVICMQDGNTFNLPWPENASMAEYMGLWKSAGHMVETTTGTILNYHCFAWARLTQMIFDTTPREQPTKQ